MLSEIINLLKEGKTYSQYELAVRLNTDIEVIKAYMEYLERYGYIKKVGLYSGCGNQCRSCSGCSQAIQNFVLWELA